MLRFFRQVRQHLLTQNKFRKYLLYAIGEIMMVVLGILVVFPFDHWNEDRKKKRLEKELLIELAARLKPDLRDVDINPDHHKEVMNSQKPVWNWIGSKEELTDYKS